MSTIDKSKWIEPSGPATFEQDGWYPGADEALKQAAKEFKGDGINLFLGAGIVFLALAILELSMELIEWACPACFGH